MLPAGPNRESRTYRPGQLVPISGVYAVVHNRHRPQHEVLAVRGDEFPACRICRTEVRFYVESIVPHMTHDFDLAGPKLRVLKGRAKAAGKSAD